jgi:feruloyl esterase
MDGLEDGLIANFTACKPQLSGLVCNGAKTAECLTSIQISALEKVFAGAKNSTGGPLYADWAWDAGISSPGWRIWKIGMYNASANSSINATLGSGAISAVFTTPPVPVAAGGAAPVEYLLNYNFDKDAPKIFAESGAYARSSWDFMLASSTDLSAFKAHGGKLLITHGVSDPVFSVNDTIAWFDQVTHNEINKLNKAKTDEWVRFFAVPGMTHCGGGPSTDQFDAFTALVNWVEKKTPPERIIATAGAMTPWPGRTRPLCPYPQYARYIGKGSIEEASNFVCK